MFGCKCLHWNRPYDFVSTEPEPFSLPHSLPQWPKGILIWFAFFAYSLFGWRVCIKLRSGFWSFQLILPFFPLFMCCIWISSCLNPGKLVSLVFFCEIWDVGFTILGWFFVFLLRTRNPQIRIFSLVSSILVNHEFAGNFVDFGSNIYILWPMSLSIVLFICFDMFLFFSALILFILKDGGVILSFGSFLAEWVCEFLVRCMHMHRKLGMGSLFSCHWFSLFFLSFFFF